MTNTGLSPDAAPNGQERHHKPVNLAMPYGMATVVGALAVFSSPKGLWFVPIVIMLVYLGFGLQLARRSGMVLEFSDSFYYLGFTFTIASLLASLDPFHFDPAKNPEPAVILHYFGLGLFTTLIGLRG